MKCAPKSTLEEQIVKHHAKGFGFPCSLAVYASGDNSTLVGEITKMKISQSCCKNIGPLSVHELLSTCWAHGSHVWTNGLWFQALYIILILEVVMQMNQVWKTTEKELLRDRSHLKYHLPIVLLLDYSYIIRYHNRKKKLLAHQTKTLRPLWNVCKLLS